MLSKAMLSLALMACVCCQVFAQKGGEVDWEAKMLTTELKSLGDPEINMILPDLYWAIKNSRTETDGSSMDKSAGAKQKVAPKPSMISLLNNPGIREEIGMLDYQYEDLQNKTREIQGEMSAQISSLLLFAKNGSVEPQRIRETIQEIRDAAQQEIEESVLPFQFQRLKQIAYHVQMNRQGVAAVITSDPLATELGITDEQRESLKETAKEIDEELAREIAKLRAKAREKLLAQLSKAQQKKLSQIIGDDLDFQELGRKTAREGTKPPKQK